MSQDQQSQVLVHRLLGYTGDGLAPRARVAAEGERLWARVLRLLAMELVSVDADREAMEVACVALQFPTRPSRPAAPGRITQLTLRDRAEQAAEIIITALGEADETLCGRAAKMLRELTSRAPEMEESRLLSDALALEDFGVSGLFAQAMLLGRQNGALASVVEGAEKRVQYGYWEARLKDGFHFEPVRQIARRRLETSQHVAELLAAELREDGLTP